MQECKLALAYCGPVLSSFEITEGWFDAQGGMIPVPVSEDEFVAAHSVLLVGYDDSMRHFRFMNSWGPEWGGQGFGYLPYDSFEGIWDEGWFMDIAYPRFRERQEGYSRRTWGFQRCGTGFVYHCVEFADPEDLRIAWALAVQREEGWLEVEELFVRPTYRRQGYGKRLICYLGEKAAELDTKLKVWISYADTEESNIDAVQKLIRPAGLCIAQSDQRWAPLVAGPSGLTGVSRPTRAPACSRPRSPLSREGLR